MAIRVLSLIRLDHARTLLARFRYLHPLILVTFVTLATNATSRVLCGHYYFLCIGYARYDTVLFLTRLLELFQPPSSYSHLAHSALVLTIGSTQNSRNGGISDRIMPIAYTSQNQTHLDCSTAMTCYVIPSWVL